MNTVALVSLGCPKNLVDSEKILGTLALDGFVPTPDPAGADVLIINTCTFIGPAQKESEETIAQAVKLKKKGKCRAVVVAGCHAQRFGAVLARKFPEVDAVLGVSSFAEVAEACRAALDAEGRSVGGQPWLKLHNPATIEVKDDARLRLTPQAWGYLRISEGCDHACSFCAIPSFRGTYRSKPMEQILLEARELVDSGARELVMIGQDTTYYGTDLYKKRRLGDLLRELDGIPRLRWIRLLYAYPSCFDETAMRAMAECKKVVPYVDMPLQHMSTSVLKRMNREETRDGIRALVGALRGTIPGLALRTTVIAGFPGETEAEFGEMLETLAELKFERLGCFPYSPERGTPAARLDSPVAPGTIARRVERVMAQQQGISLAFNRARVGTTVPVLVEGTGAPADESPSTVAEGGKVARDIRSPGPTSKRLRAVAGWGRSYAEAPEVDGVVLLSSRRKLKPGEWVEARVREAGPYDLIASVVN